jgi:hypothetical protein
MEMNIVLPCTVPGLPLAFRLMKAIPKMRARMFWTLKQAKQCLHLKIAGPLKLKK